jgi:Ras-related protein Rab-2A
MAFKLLVAGDGGVGKTTLLYRYVNNVFIADTSMTIGVQLHVKNMNFEGKEYALQIWDLGGQDRFRFILQQYALGAKGALLLYDLTRFQTTFELESSWLPIVRQENPNLPVILVGTKKDLIKSSNPSAGVFDPTVPLGIVKKLSLQGFIDVSAKTGENVENAFELILKSMLDNSR